MIYIEHRRNTLESLKSIQFLQHGAEIDLRSHVNHKGHIHLSHDAWTEGDNFEHWLDQYVAQKIQGPILLNTKEDGLEDRTIELLQTRKIENYFFLDTAWPTAIRLIKQGLGARLFLRLSRYEDLENLLKFKGKVDWLWADCFDSKPLPIEIIMSARQAFKICLVSPELQKGSFEDFHKFKETVPFCEAICTKDPASWKKILA